jgi:hypothetical protein
MQPIFFKKLEHKVQSQKNVEVERKTYLKKKNSRKKTCSKMHLQNIVMRGEMSGIMAMLEGCGAVLGIEDRWRWDMGGV